MSLLPRDCSTKEFRLLYILVAIAALPRLLLLYYSGFVIDSDEAIVGLMAMHFAEGQPWAVFYYGQAYMGSLEPLLVALVFLVFGPSPAALKSVPLAFSLLHVVLVYALARRFVSPAFSFLAGLLAAVGPHALVTWSGMSRGGFIELVVLGSISLIYAIDILRQDTPGARKLIGLGIVLGLGWWVNNQIVFYLFPIAVVFAWHFPFKYSWIVTLRSALLLIAGFFFGSLPFWYANIFSKPKWASFEVLFAGHSPQTRLQHLQGLFEDALPIIFGARRFWSDAEVFQHSSPLAYVLYLTALILSVISLRQRSNRGMSLLLLFFVSVGFIFTLSSFGWLAKAPRYLLPLYSTLFVYVAVAASVLWSWGVFGRVLAVCLFSGVLGIQLASNYTGSSMVPGQPVVFQGQRVSEEHGELYRFLFENQHSHIYTNYWIGYRVAFETAERVTFSRFGRPRSIRIEAYESEDRNRPMEERVFVLVPAEAALFRSELIQFAWRFRETEVSGYIVFDQLQRAYLAGERIELQPSQIQIDLRPDWVPGMLDGDPETRWGSGVPQHPAMSILVELPEPLLLTGVGLDFSSFVHDAPRVLRVSLFTPEGEKLTVFYSGGTKLSDDLHSQDFSEVPSYWDIRFRPTLAAKLILEQEGSDPVFDWSLAELELFATSE